jgi:hypothetical protein
MLLLPLGAGLLGRGHQSLEVQGASGRVEGIGFGRELDFVGAPGRVAPKDPRIHKMTAQGDMIQPQVSSKRKDPTLELLVDLTLGVGLPRLQA